MKRNKNMTYSELDRGLSIFMWGAVLGVIACMWVTIESYGNLPSMINDCQKDMKRTVHCEIIAVPIQTHKELLQQDEE